MSSMLYHELTLIQLRDIISDTADAYYRCFNASTGDTGWSQSRTGKSLSSIATDLPIAVCQKFRKIPVDKQNNSVNGADNL